jgi:hypothetical protein
MHWRAGSAALSVEGRCCWSSRGDRQMRAAGLGADRISARGFMMFYPVFKALLSGVIVAAASEAAKRSPTYGSLILSLPLLSILAMIWLWRDTGDSQRIAALSEGTFWLVLPTLPLFLMLPVLLRHGLSFWLALGASCAMTFVLYLVTLWLLPKLGVDI